MQGNVRYPYPYYFQTVDDTEVYILGVRHDKHFFNEQEENLKEFVDVQDALVLEKPADGDDFFGLDFYRNLGSIAAEQDKKVYQADPVNMDILRIDQGLVSLIGLTVGCDALRTALRRLRKAGKMTRRDFLRKGTIVSVLAAGPLILGSYPGMTVKDHLGLDSDSSLGQTAIDDAFSYGMNDYRNVTIAKRVEELCRENPDLKRVGVAHGAAHSQPIDMYLKNPALRTGKGLAYVLYDIFGSRMREYTPTSDGWVLTNQF